MKVNNKQLRMLEKNQFNAKTFKHNESQSTIKVHEKVSSTFRVFGGQ